MMSLIKFLKNLFSKDNKQIIKHFLNSELDDINYEIRKLENRRNELEVMVFGN